MKQKTILFALLLLLLSAAAVFADDFSPEFIQQQESMLRSIDQYFPQILVTDTFDPEIEPEIDKVGDGIYISTRKTRAGKYEWIIFADKPVTESTSWGTYKDGIGFYSDFYVSIEGQILERDDSEKGYIHFTYSDDEIVGGSDASWCCVNFPINVVKENRSAGESDEQIMTDLTQYGTDYDNHRFEIIRLHGYTSVFIDRRFVTGFADGFSGQFNFSWGVGLYPGGKYVTGQFDNLLIRVK